MGSVLYDFLNDSPLLDPTMIEELYSSLTETHLRSELDRYRGHCLAHWNDLLDEIGGAQTSLRLSAGEPFRRLDILKQAAFYLDAVVLPDPLFPHTEEPSKVGQVMSQYFEMPQAEEINRKDLAQAAAFMNDVRLMVAANYVRFFPISYFSEVPTQIPVRYSPTQFEELLAKPILEHYRRAASIKSLRRGRDGWILQRELTLGRGIGIQFERDSPENLYIYNLFVQEVVKMEEESRTAQVQLSLPDEPPTPSEFGLWVNQSVNSAAHRHFEALTRDLSISARCNAMYLTNSTFIGSLLDSSTATHSSLHTDITRFVLNLDLPVFQDIRVDDLMYARGDEDAFDLFRRELEKQFRELRLEKDPEKLKLKVQNAMHELTEVQATKVAQSVDRLRKRFAAESAVALAGLVGTVATSGLSLLATLLAAAQGYKTVAEYQRSVRENPAYFLWRVRRS